MNITVIGTGYVGLSTGLGFAKLGHSVTCVDVNEEIVKKLQAGEVTFYEPGLQELLDGSLRAEKVRFVSDLSESMNETEVFIIAVGTPAMPDGTADLRFVFQVADSLGNMLEHPAVVIVKSTVPVGTNRRVLERIQERLVDRGLGAVAKQVRIASLPEFLRPGRAVEDFFKSDRIVIGVDDQETGRMIDKMHEGVDAPRVIVRVESAELAKYAANAFLASKVSFINEIANFADQTGANVQEVAEVMGLDPRIGPHFLRAGVGFGGFCFPKDVSALHKVSDFKMLSATLDVNANQPLRFLRTVEHALGGFRGKTIAVWGLAFKGGTDDVRGSIAIDLVRLIAGHGAEVRTYDPQATELARLCLPEHICFATTAVEASQGADALLILTEWPEFRDVDFSQVKTAMSAPTIFDGKNLLADLDLAAHGFAYRGVGLGYRN